MCLGCLFVVALSTDDIVRLLALVLALLHSLGAAEAKVPEESGGGAIDQLLAKANGWLSLEARFAVRMPTVNVDEQLVNLCQIVTYVAILILVLYYRLT